jgi:hypothetical protein
MDLDIRSCLEFEWTKIGNNVFYKLESDFFEFNFKKSTIYNIVVFIGVFNIFMKKIKNN